MNMSTLSDSARSTRVLCGSCAKHVLTLDPGEELLSRRDAWKATREVRVDCPHCGSSATIRVKAS